MMIKLAAAVSFTSFVLVAACTRHEGTAPKLPPAARACASVPPENGNTPPGMSGVTFQCHADSDCTAGREGRCSFSGGGHEVAIVRCTYDTCGGDTDCGSGRLCICGSGGETRNECIPSNCHDSADCGGNTCESSWGSARATPGRYCHTASDKCASASDCSSGETCDYAKASSRWECMAAMPHPVG